MLGTRFRSENTSCNHQIFHETPLIIISVSFALGIAVQGGLFQTRFALPVISHVTPINYKL
jgi:hypothetical protein